MNDIRIEYDDLVAEIAEIHSTLKRIEKNLPLVGPSTIGPGVPVGERRSDSTALEPDHVWVRVWKSLAVVTDVCNNMETTVGVRVWKFEGVREEANEDH